MIRFMIVITDRDPGKNILIKINGYMLFNEVADCLVASSTCGLSTGLRMSVMGYPYLRQLL